MIPQQPTTWLATAPPHWRIEPIKRLVTFVKNAVDRQATSRPYVSLDHVESWTGRLLHDASQVGLAPDFAVADLFEPGDILFGKLRPYLAKVVRADFAGCCSPELFVLRPYEDVETRFLQYALLNTQFIQFVSAQAHGTKMPRVDAETTGRIRIPIPPADRQREIADFLDRQILPIDALIKRASNLIETLSEHWQHNVDQLLTPGVMSEEHHGWAPVSPPLLPDEWQVVPLKHLVRIQPGLTLGKDYGTKAIEARPYLRVANVQAGRLDLGHIANVQVPGDVALRHELRTDDVLMTEGGDYDKLGRGHVWTGEIEGCLHQNHIFALRCDGRKLAPRYLAWLTSSSYARAYFTITSKQSTNLASTNQMTIGAFPVLLPPIAEQEAIVAQIDQRHRRHIARVTAIQGLRRLLFEYRSTLVDGSVTGVIDTGESVG